MNVFGKNPRPAGREKKNSLFRQGANETERLVKELEKNTTASDFLRNKTGDLTASDLLFANKAAILHFEHGDIEGAVPLFNFLCKDIAPAYPYEEDITKAFTVILFNCAQALCRLGKYRNSLKVTEKGEQLCVSHQRSTPMPLFALIRAYNLFLLGKAKESLQHFNLAYCGFRSIQDEESVAMIAAFVKEQLNHDLDD